MKLQHFILTLFTVLSVTSCTETINLELEDPSPVLVVDGYITNQDTTQFVKLSQLENYFSDKAPNYAVYKSATVTLQEDSVAVGSFAFNTDKQRFEIQYQGKIGAWYQIHISLPDGTSYLSAAEIMEEVVPIDSIWFEVADVNGPGATKGDYAVYINTHEPKGYGDNYQWKSYVNDSYNFLAQDMFVADDRFVDGEKVDDLDVYSMSPEEFQEKKAESPTSQVIVKIEQLHISYRYLQYLLLINQQLLQVGSPFAAPPAEIRGNVYKQGENEVLALGYFYTSAVSTAEVEIIE